MDPICMLLVTAAVLLCADLAHASCALTVDGDPELVARIKAALATFPDDPASCIAIRVVCARADNQIIVELRDELGRSARRTFASTDGAAAFLISWSRRPLPFDGVFRTEQTSTAAMMVVVREAEARRHRSDVRRLDAPMRYDATMQPVLWVAGDAEATAGLEQTWLGRIRMRGEPAGSLAHVTRQSMADLPNARSLAMRAAIRATVTSRLTSAMGLAAGLGWDVAQADAAYDDGPPSGPPPSASSLRHPLHVEVGLQWAP